MIRKSVVTISLLAIVAIAPVYSNPIAINFINEVQITETGWFIELHSEYDLWEIACLATNSDTAYFNDTLTIDSGFLVITPDSLQSSLTINPANDIIRLGNWDNILDYFAVGNANYEVPVTLSPTQSICCNTDGHFDYLDDSPTIGYANDDINAKGEISGIITDAKGNPVADVRVEDIPLEGGRMAFDIDTTASDGSYSWYGWARQNTLEFSLDGYTTQRKTIMIYPDSTINLDIALEQIVDTTLALSYFPLQVGNIWNYSTWSGGLVEWTATVKDTNLIAGYLHYQYCDTSDNPVYSKHCHNIRWDSTGKILKSDGSLWFDFTLNDGDSIKMYDDESSYFYFHVLNRNISITTTAGVFDSCISILFDDTLLWDDESIYWFAPDVGIVKMFFEGVRPIDLELHSAYINGQYLSIDESPETIIFRLNDNYPNPFNPVTTISYELPRHMPVRIAIYNLLGREVAVLVDGVQGPGVREVLWDAANLASGIYFYQLQTETRVITNKLVLLK